MNQVQGNFIRIPFPTRQEFHKRIVTDWGANCLINTGNCRTVPGADESHDEDTEQIEVLTVEKWTKLG